MSSQPPYGSYPPQNQPWPEQPSEPAYPDYGQPPSAYPPPPQYPPQYGAMPYPPPPQAQQPPVYGTPPMYGTPNIYVQPPVPYPYVVAAPPEPGAGQAVTSLVLGIIGTVFGVMSWIPCLGVIPFTLGIIGLVMGILGFKSTTRHGMAVTGFVLSIIAVLLPLAFFVLLIISSAISTQ